MKTLKILLYLNILFMLEASAQVSAIYAGGPLYYGRDYALDELKSSGFNTVIVWTIHIQPNGDLNFNGEFPLVENGVYVGDLVYPKFPADMAYLKEAPTSIDRVEFGLSAGGSDTYESVKALFEAEGVGTESILYKNFAALRAAIPSVDALNNDDESTYDLPSAVAFTKMCAEIGFKNAIVPYRVSNFWGSLVSQVNAEYPGNIDRNYLQRYAGGAGNDPCSATWDFGIPVYPGLWGGTTHDSPETVENQMTTWKNSCGIDGGFIWLYDDFDDSPEVAQFGFALRNAFGLTTEIPAQASGPSPQDKATEVSVDTEMSWIGGSFDAKHKLYFSTSPVFIELDTVMTFNTSRYSPETLENNKTYYWKVDEINSLGTTKGQTWSFTTEVTTAIPEKVKALSPTNQSKNASLKPMLTWEAADRAVSYDIYLGVSNPPEFLGTTESLTFPVAEDLNGGENYYWRVDAKNNGGVKAGDVWQFATRGENLAPNATISVSSEFPDPNWGKRRLTDGIVMVNARGEWASNRESKPWAKLEWTSAQAVGSISLYDRPNSAESIQEGLLTFSDESEIVVGALPNGGEALTIEFERKDITWVKFQVTESQGPNIGLSEFEVSQYVDFSAMPEQAFGFIPENEAKDVTLDLTLEWQKGLFAKSHKLYLSKDETIDESDFVIDQAETQYDVESIDPGQKYYWRVDEVNENGTTQGPVLNFITEDPLNAKMYLDQVQVYPNPSSSIVKIELPKGITGTLTLTVYNLSGEVVFREDQTKRYHAEGLLLWDMKRGQGEVRPGVYFAEVSTGFKSFNFKILVNE